MEVWEAEASDVLDASAVVQRVTAWAEDDDCPHILHPPPHTPSACNMRPVHAPRRTPVVWSVPLVAATRPTPRAVTIADEVLVPLAQFIHKHSTIRLFSLPAAALLSISISTRRHP